MTQLSNSTAARLIDRLGTAVRHVPRLITIDTQGYMSHCGCVRCRGIRFNFYGCSDPLPRNTPLGFGPVAGEDTMFSRQVMGMTRGAADAFSRGDMAGYMVEQQQGFARDYPLVPNPYADPWSR